MHQEWGRLLGVLELLSRDRVYGGEQLHEQVGRTSSLLDAARKAAGLPPARAQAAAEGIRLEASAAWAGWQLVETELTRRLMVDLSMPEDKAASIALLAALGCVSCALLLWQTWHAGQLRNDAALVESKVRESDARYRAMTETAREVLIQADPSGRILRSNHKLAVTEMTALFSQPHTWEKTIAGLERTVGGGPAPPVEAWIAGEGDGSPVEWRAFPVRDAAGRLVRVDSALLDVGTWYAARQAAQSRIAEHEQSLRKLQLQLRELLDQSFELAESRAALEQASQTRIEALCNWGRRVSQPLEEAAALASRLRSNARPLHPNDTAALVQAVDSVAASLRAPTLPGSNVAHSNWPFCPSRSARWWRNRLNRSPNAPRFGISSCRASSTRTCRPRLSPMPAGSGRCSARARACYRAHRLRRGLSAARPTQQDRHARQFTL